MVRKYRNQDYSKLKREAQQRGELFTDPEFPATAASLFKSGKNEHDIVWKRPGEICSNPKMVVAGISSTDLNQGQLGNCWFVAACSAIAGEKKLWDKVVHNFKEQEWNDAHPERYAGIFHFQFWILGHWYDVVIDDWLPTKNGKLIYMKSSDRQPNEFWSALLEKAYAKVAGSYEALAGGQTGDALVNFTGGVNQAIDIREGGYTSDDEKATNLFKELINSFNHHALISCSIRAETAADIEGVLECGLIKGHAYCVIDIKKISPTGSVKSMFRNREKVLMLKLRNPWGMKEWNGAWSDGSPEWNRVSQKERTKLGIKTEDDGEFWMEFHDWLTWFTDCSVCWQVNTSLLSLETTYHESQFDGKWEGRSAGGCVNHKDTVLHNPQYAFTIPRDDTELMVSLTQKDTRFERGQARSRAGSHDGNFSIGFYIMKVEENRKFRMHALQEKAGSITFTNRVSVFGKFDTLGAGRYVIVPSTFDPGQEREFLLRLFTTRTNRAIELTKEAPTRGILGYLCCCCYSSPQALVTVHLDGATGLEKQDRTGKGADPYCVVICEGSKAQTPYKADTLDPNFNSRVVFYPRKPNSTEIKIQVWNHNLVVDSFMGQVMIPIPRDGESLRHTMRLMQRGRNSGQEASGTITFRIECSHNLQAS